LNFQYPHIFYSYFPILKICLLIFFNTILVAHKGFPKHQPLISYITNDLHCDPKTEMDSQNINTLLNYVKGLKVEFMVPMQPNTKRLHKVVGIFDSASKFT